MSRRVECWNVSWLKTLRGYPVFYKTESYLHKNEAEECYDVYVWKAKEDIDIHSRYTLRCMTEYTSDGVNRGKDSDSGDYKMMSLVGTLEAEAVTLSKSYLYLDDDSKDAEAIIHVDDKENADD